MQVCGKDIKITGRLIRLAQVAAEGYEFIEDPEAAIAALRDLGARVDVFSFTQRLAESAPKYGYLMQLDNLAVLPITTFDNWWSQIGVKTRNRARHAAKKGLVIREVPYDDKLAKGIWRIYNECPVRQGRAFPHYGEDLDTVRATTSTFPESSIYIGAFLGEELVGFLKLTMDESRTQAGIMYILSLIQHRDKSPTNALLAEAVRVCAERGIPNCFYSRFEYDAKRQDGLTDFKENNGFRRADVFRYFVPLTPVGRLALHLGLHGGVQKLIPEALLTRMRELRTSWYKRKFRTDSQMSVVSAERSSTRV